MSIETSKTKHYIRGFDGIRAIAVLVVIAGHANLTYPMLGKSHPVIYNMVAAPRGVDIFFVLSGFLITTLLLGEMKRDGWISLRNFYVRRAFRILPLYYFFLIMLIAISAVARTDFDWKGIPWLLFNVYNFAPRAYRSSVDGHIWSLAVEWHYYLVWPLVFVLLYPSRIRLIGILSLFLCIGAAAYQFIPVGTYNYAAWTMPAATPIAVGAIAALLMGEKRLHWSILIFGFALYWRIAAHGTPFGTAPAVRAVAIATFIAWIYTNQRSAIVSVLEFEPLRYIGAISYGLYIWHVLLIGTGPGRIEGQTWPPDQLTGLALLVLVAPLSYHFFELPVQSWQARFLRRKLSLGQREHPLWRQAASRGRHRQTSTD